MSHNGTTVRNNSSNNRAQQRARNSFAPNLATVKGRRRWEIFGAIKKIAAFYICSLTIYSLTYHHHSSDESFHHIFLLAVRLLAPQSPPSSSPSPAFISRLAEVGRAARDVRTHLAAARRRSRASEQHILS